MAFFVLILHEEGDGIKRVAYHGMARVGQGRAGNGNLDQLVLFCWSNGQCMYRFGLGAFV